MVTKIYNQQKSSKYKWSKKGGRNLIGHKPVFSPDKESLLIQSKDTIRVHNIKTGELVRVLEQENDITDLISVEFPEKECYNLYGLSKNGKITTWTWETGAVLRERELNIPEKVNICTFNLLNSQECFITGTVEKYTVYLATYSIVTGALMNEYSMRQLVYYNIWNVVIALLNGRKCAAICNGTPRFFIVDIEETQKVYSFQNYNDIRIISIAAHPSNSCIAIGDALGRAALIHGDLLNEKRRVRDEFHWHSLPLFAMTFSVQGNYLLTGGMEKVLVKWALGSLAKKAKDQQFLPRLPGIIKYIATNDEHIAITTSNNSILIVDIQFKLQSTIMECGGLTQISRSLGPGLIYHRQLGALVLGGRAGHLQLFSTCSSKVLYNFDVTRLNQIPATRANLIPIDVEVTSAGMSAIGDWLVTSEYRNDTITYPEERLKFWEFKKEDGQLFKLNTCVMLSHGGCRVNAIILDTDGKFCVTSGSDEKFRVWRYRDTVNRISWFCYTVCYYGSGLESSLDQMGVLRKPPEDIDEFQLHYLRSRSRNDILAKIFHGQSESQNDKYKISCINLDEIRNNIRMGGVDISDDSSLIAAWFGAKLTLWDTGYCYLKTTLAHPSLRPHGVHVKFGHKDCAHFLACTTSDMLAVWNLLSYTINWLVQITPVTLVSDPFSNKMAVVNNNNDVVIFTPQTSEPIFMHESLVPASEGSLRDCTFKLGIDGNDCYPTLFFMRNDCEIFSLEAGDESDHKYEIISKRKPLTSNFSALIAETKTSEIANLKPVEQYFDSQSAGRAAIIEYFSSPAHTIPSISILCLPFLEHVSGVKEESELEFKDEPKSEYFYSSDSGDEYEYKNVNRDERKVNMYDVNDMDESYDSLNNVINESIEWAIMLY